MPYNLSFFDGRPFITLADGVVDQQASSSLYLIGKDVTSYGTIQNDNFLWLLENFAGTVEPVNKVQGQIWFDKNSNVLKPKVYDGGEWRPFGMMTASSTSSTNATTGDFWFKTDDGQLYIKNGVNYTLIGPDLVPGFGVTKFISRRILDTENDPHACIIMYVDGSILGAVSNDEFDVNVSEEIYAAGIVRIGRGFNFSSGAAVTTDDVYLKADVNEVITGRWSFNNINGVGIGTSAIFNSETGNLTLQAIGKSVVVNASEFRPFGSTVNLGTPSNKFAKVYTTEINAGSSVTTANLVGKFILSSSSKLEPGTDGTISLGAANARFATVFSKGLNAGGTNEEGMLIGQWKLDPLSSFDASQGSITADQFNANSANIVTTLQAQEILTPRLSTGSSSQPGTIVGNWILSANSRLQATYADIAEKYSSDIDYEPGTVVMFGGSSEVTIANLPKTTKVAGIVTTEPAQILNTNLENAVAIALVGRVPCKVVGQIFKGDMLVVSHIPGVLTSDFNPKPGTIVAKALEFYNSEEAGVIEVMVTRG